MERYGGAQRVMVDVHNGLKKHNDAKIIGFQKFEELHPKYGIQREEYVLLRHPWQLNGKTVAVHSRNLIPFFVFIKKILFLNTKIVYVHHNVYDDFGNYTFFPETIVSTSKRATKNLVEYFKQDPKKITLIYNGIIDTEKDTPPIEKKKDKSIKIIYAARVNRVKQQLLIVENLKNKLDPNVEIHIAGVGDDFEALKTLCEGLPNFKVLGFVSDIVSLMKEYDYMMLYSIQEALPLALIEAIMCSKPLLVNDVGGNLEICEPGKNGIELKDWDSLASQLNGLKNISDEEYNAMAVQSRKIFLQKFQYDEMIKNYRQLIEVI